jgi:hypothetical protein
MPPENENHQNLNIRCPSCRQRFSVSDELMNRMVECGGCTTRFRINDDVIVQSKKFYPGEKRKTPLNRISRVPLSSTVPAINIETARYQDSYHPELAEPISAQRLIAGAFGVLLLLGSALVIILSSSGNKFSTIPFQSKLIITAFIALVGMALIIYANPRTRIKATIISLLLGAGLFSIPFFTRNEIPIVSAPPKHANPQQPVLPDTTPNATDELRKRFITTPLEKEQQRLALQNNAGSAYGIYITNLMGRNKLTARDFLIRETGADVTSHPYPRDNNNYLMILNGVTKPIGEVAAIAGKLGTTDEIHPDIGVVVISVNNQLFVPGSAEKLNDKSDPAFYDLNLLELQSIDLYRIRAAVERLVDAEPSIYRDDVSTLFIALMKNPGVKFHDVLSRALMRWSDDYDAAAAAALIALKTYYTSQNVIPPESLVALVVKGKNDNAIPAITSLWLNSPVANEDHLAAFGQDAEPIVIKQLVSEEATVRHSALKILGKVGTASSLPLLRGLLDHQDPETRVLADRAIQEIEAR